MGMMKRCDGELELVREAHHVVEVDRLVAVVVDLHASSQDIDQRLPLQVFREGPKVCPLAGSCLCAIFVLGLFDLAGRLVGRAEGPSRVHACEAIDAAWGASVRT